MTWKNIYETDATGTRVRGSLNTMIREISKGSPIRVNIYSSDGGIQAFQPEHIWIHEGVVFVQTTTRYSTAYQRSKMLLADHNENTGAAPNWQTEMIDSSGNREVMHWVIGKPDVIKHDFSKVALRWFIPPVSNES